MPRLQREKADAAIPRVDAALVPRRVVHPFAFAGHLPFVLWLVPRWRPRRIVELGVHTGNSLFAFAQAAAELRADGHPCEVFGVDTWQGDEHSGRYGEEIFAAVSRVAKADHPDGLELVRSTFDDAVSRFEPGSIDLLHIDGFHTYEAVRHDFDSWRDRLSDRGVVLLHDVCVTDRADFGVHRFWEEIRQSHPHATFTHAHGLGVLFTGTKLGVLERRVVETLVSAETFPALAESMATLGRLLVAAPESASEAVSPEAPDPVSHLRGDLAAMAGMLGAMREEAATQDRRQRDQSEAIASLRGELAAAETRREHADRAAETSLREELESARRERDRLQAEALAESNLAAAAEARAVEAIAAANALRDEAEALREARNALEAGLAAAQLAADLERARAVEAIAAANALRDEAEALREARNALEAGLAAAQLAADLERARAVEAIEDRRREAADLRRNLRVAEQRSGDLAESLREGSARLGSLVETCERLRGEAATERAACAGLRDALDARLRERRSLEDRVSGLESLVEALRRSTSWRLTAPLRWIARGFRRDPGEANAATAPARSAKPSLWWSIAHRARRPSTLLRSSRRAFEILRREGPRGVARAIGLARQTHAAGGLSTADLRSLRRPRDPVSSAPKASTPPEAGVGKAGPLVSIVVPVFDTPAAVLREAIESVRRQTWSNWELLLVDDASKAAPVAAILAEAASSDPRIRALRRETNGGISAATNDGLAAASGTWVAFLDHDDLLEPEAIEACVRSLEAAVGDVAYTDQVTVDAEGRPVWAFRKPSWSPAHLRHVMYVGHLLVVRRSLAIEAGGFRSEHDGVQDFEFMLRLGERTDRVVHVPRLLYRWRAIEGSLAAASDAKQGISEKQARAVQAHLERVGTPGEASPDPRRPHRCRIEPALATRPRVSIVIPTKDQPEHIRACLDSIHERTRWPDLEVVLVDTGTTDPQALAAMRKHPAQIVAFDRPFNFSAACNAGAAAATGSILVFLNNDTEVITPEWLDHLVLHLVDEGVGAAGPLLFYPDGTVQHAGVVLGPRGTADHVMRGFPADADGYAGSLSTPREVSAVTGACLAIRRETFERIGGFREAFGTHYQDVDLCLRLRRAGLRIVCTPEARLHHHESPSRGSAYDFLDRLLLLDTWGDLIAAGDPYYPAACSLERLDYSVDPARAEAIL